jgi:hypothetical protein
MSNNKLGLAILGAGIIALEGEFKTAILLTTNFSFW